MKILKFTRWLLLALAILCFALLLFLVFTGNSYVKMRAVGNVTEDLICDILFISTPVVTGLAALADLIVIIKRCYGPKIFMSAMAGMFIVIGAIVFLARGVRTDRLMRSFESPDGKHMLYYVQEHNGYIETERMRVYRRTGMLTYDALFTVDNSKAGLIEWDDDGVRFDNEKFEYSSYTAK